MLGYARLSATVSRIAGTILRTVDGASKQIVGAFEFSGAPST